MKKKEKNSELGPPGYKWIDMDSSKVCDSLSLLRMIVTPVERAFSLNIQSTLGSHDGEGERENFLINLFVSSSMTLWSSSTLGYRREG